MKLPEILRNKNFTYLLTAGALSEIGSYMSKTAIMLYVFEISLQQKSYLGISNAFFLVLLTMGGFSGGAIGDRKSRKQLLILSEISRIPLVIALMFLESVWPVLIVQAFIGFFTGVFNPNRQAIINDILPTKQITRANSLFGSLIAGIHIIGPVGGAAFYVHFSGIKEVLIFDLVTYFLGIILLSKIKYKRLGPKQKEQDNRINILGDIKDQFSLIAKRKDLHALYLNNMVIGLCIGILIPLLLPFTHEVLGEGDKQYGQLMGALGVGGVIGGFLSHYLSNYFSIGKLITVLACIESAMMIFWIQIDSFHLSLFFFLVWGSFVFARIPSQLNYISRTVQSSHLSRSLSFLELAFVAPNIIGGIIIAFIGNRFSAYEILLINSIMFVCLIFLRIPTKHFQALYHGKS